MFKEKELQKQFKNINSDEVEFDRFVDIVKEYKKKSYGILNLMIVFRELEKLDDFQMNARIAFDVSIVLM